MILQCSGVSVLYRIHKDTVGCARHTLSQSLFYSSMTTVSLENIEEATAAHETRTKSYKGVVMRMVAVGVFFFCIAMLVAWFVGPFSPCACASSPSLSTQDAPLDHVQLFCVHQLATRLGLPTMYWNTTQRPARTWLHLCHKGWRYDPSTDAFTDEVRAWYDGTAELLFARYLDPDRTRDLWEFQ